jgi:hypothetical protein
MLTSVVIILTAGGFGLIYQKYNGLFQQNVLSRFSTLSRIIVSFIVFFCVAVYFVLIYSPIGVYFMPLGYRLLFLFLLTSVSTLVLKFAFPALNSRFTFIGFLLGIGVINRIFVLFPSTQAIPFSLGWSEGSDLYNASLFFSSKVYGQQLPLPLLNPSRYLLQSIAFLFNPKSILFHRYWQMFLWVVIYSITSFAFVKRVGLKNRFVNLLLGLWVFLFLYEIHVYYDLLVCVFIILIGYQKDSIQKTMFFVVLASIWAGISRVNWFPMPGALATLIYLLENPKKNLNWLKYLKIPMFYLGLGTLISTASYILYIALSGNPLDYFFSSYTSYLIWHRLLPNETFPPGILLGLLMVITPLFILLADIILQRGFRIYWEWCRGITVVVLLLIFLMGGILVSIKVGGGSDLHNMDAFFILFLTFALSIGFNKFTMEDKTEHKPYKINILFLFAVIILPVISSIRLGSVMHFPSAGVTQRELWVICELLDSVKNDNREVLFISEKQLVTYHFCGEVRFSKDYEKIPLMEWAMSNNNLELHKFYEALQKRNFSMIIMDSVYMQRQKKGDVFWIENNLWTDKVLHYVLENYQWVIGFERGKINILIPKNYSDP